MNFLTWYGLYIAQLLVLYGQCREGNEWSVVTFGVLVLFGLAVPRKEKRLDNSSDL